MANISRNYRPKNFSDVVGQSNIIETLRREVEQSKLGHAYLFSGPRGIGKTTIARIFAKAVNCQKSNKGEPCQTCESCKRITEGNAIDVIEMDAASHTGVDNVREAIVEHVRFVPAALKYKVYIIDEAHMLSVNAWNALLKTIEEPPDYAIFIFATTEKHKVPATIISRCQRFNFSRITENEIFDRIKDISKQEGIKIDDSVAKLIAQKTDGCLRDAENLLGQLMSLGEKNITQDVASIIIPPSQMPIAAELLSLTANKNIPQILTRIEQLEQEGLAFIPLFDDLIAAVRKLSLALNLPDKLKALQQGDEAEKILSELSNKVSNQKLLQDTLILMEKRRETKQGLDPRFALELALMAMAIDETANSELRTENSELKTENRPNPKISHKPSDTNTETKTSQSNSPTTSSQTSDVRPLDLSAPEAHPPLAETSRPPTFDIGAIRTIWPKFLQAFEQNKSLTMLLKPSRPTDVQGNSLVIQFQYPYHLKTAIENVKNKQLIEDILAKLSGIQGITIQGTVANSEQGKDTAAKPKTDAVSTLLDAFGGQIIS